MIISIDGVAVEIKKKRIRSMRITVYPTGQVVLSMPVFTPIAQGEKFIKSKISWIKSRLNKIKLSPIKKDREYISGESFDLLGKKYVLRIEKSKENYSKIYGNEIVIKVKSDTFNSRKKAVAEFYKNVLREIIENRLPFWENKTGLRPTYVEYKNLKSVWGRCENVKGSFGEKKITFAYQLATKPIEFIDYVIMHELCHIKEFNHGEKFKTLETKFLPTWKEIKKAYGKDESEYTTKI